MSETPCVFCKIVAGEAPGNIMKDWDVAIALVPLTPVVDGHVLIIPKLHVVDAAEDPETTANTMACAAEYAGIHDSFNLITSAGRAATQSIDHLHIHVVPRTVDDGLMTPWGTIYGDNPAAPHLCRKLKQVADLHIARDGNIYPECQPYFRCVEDGEEWPCATAEALGVEG